jgi:cytochrome c-type biogenesis protein CcmE
MPPRLYASYAASWGRVIFGRDGHNGSGHDMVRVKLSGLAAGRQSAMTRRQRRLVLIGGSIGVLGLALGLVLNALSGSIVFFNSPTDIKEKNIAVGTRIRIGGLVKDGSVQRGDNLRIRFEVTDGKNDVPVRFQGIVPDLFREGQGVVAEGKMEPGGVLDADTVLAKHDERYMPKEVVDALKKSGRWEESEGKVAGGKTQ